MKNLFISWSGNRSQLVAEALNDWIPCVIQSADPWLSVADIEKGSRWNTEIASQLQKQQIGIVCLTAENLNAPWLLFEAGALSKAIENSRVCTFLLDIQPTDVQGPLAQFQHTRAEREDIKKLAQTVNRAFGDLGLSEKMLDKQFEMWWPTLETRLSDIPKIDESKIPKRIDRELLEEVLELTRSIKRDKFPSTSLPSGVHLEKELKQREIVIRTRLGQYRQQISDLERKFPNESDANASPELQGLRKKRAALQSELNSLKTLLRTA